MKTLEQVIECLESGRCHYNACQEAVHYLKEYREKLLHFEEIYKQFLGILQEMVDLETRKKMPLTWEEMRTMNGDSVWIELPAGGKWYLIQSDVSFGNAIFIERSGYRVNLFEKDLGKTWKAYRKKV